MSWSRRPATIETRPRSPTPLLKDLSLRRVHCPSTVSDSLIPTLLLHALGTGTNEGADSRISRESGHPAPSTRKPLSLRSTRLPLMLPHSAGVRPGRAW
jgi:hypothetical protein